jgi:hypothetical protein
MNRIHVRYMLYRYFACRMFPYGSTGNPVQDFLKKIFGKNPCMTPYMVGGLCVPKARGSPLEQAPPASFLKRPFLRDAIASSWHPGEF